MMKIYDLLLNTLLSLVDGLSFFALLVRQPMKPKEIPIFCPDNVLLRLVSKNGAYLCEVRGLRDGTRDALLSILFLRSFRGYNQVEDRL